MWKGVALGMTKYSLYCQKGVLFKTGTHFLSIGEWVDYSPDKVILQYYIDKLNDHGGKSLAAYHTGVCLIDEDGNINSGLIKEKKFLLTSQIDSESIGRGGVLDCISYDLEANKYFAKRTEEDKKKHYEKLDKDYRDLVKKYILNKNKS